MSLCAGAVVIAARLAATSAAPDTRQHGEPMPVPGVSRVLWRDEFDHAASDGELLKSYVTLRAGGMHRDPTAGLNGSGALRIDWASNPGCGDDGRVLERSFAPVNDIVVQYSVRYTPGFAFDWRGRGRCAGNAKKLFFLWAASGSRFDFVSENHELGMGSDYDHPLFTQNTGATITPETLGDGNWHRVTVRVRQSSTPLARDGAISGWIDGILRWEYTGIASHASGGWTLVKLPTTFNQGSPINQSEWLDGWSIWRP